MGNSEIVSVGMLSVEDEDSLSWMFNTLRTRNSEMSRVRVIVTDKDLKERQVLRQCFPTANLLLCLFHTLRTFRREVTCERMGISGGQRSTSLELMQKLAYAGSEESYKSLYEQFTKDAPHTVVSYYNQNWHSNRAEWVRGHALLAGNFLNNTNNRLECINSKLKSVVTKFSSLEEFLDKLYIIIGAMRLERDSKSATEFLKVSTSASSFDPVEKEYLTLLTPYAAGFVHEQLKKSSRVVLKHYGGDAFGVDLGESVLDVSTTSCSCSFRSSMLLPCSHIFAVRLNLTKDLYDSQLCDPRWFASYFKANGRVFNSRQGNIANIDQHIGAAAESSDNGNTSKSIAVHCQPTKSRRVFTGPEKVKLGLKYGAALANLHADVGSEQFTERLDVYRQLERLWQRGRRAVVVELGDDVRYPFGSDTSDMDEIQRASTSSDGYMLDTAVAHEVGHATEDIACNDDHHMTDIDVMDVREEADIADVILPDVEQNEIQGASTSSGGYVLDTAVAQEVGHAIEGFACNDDHHMTDIDVQDVREEADIADVILPDVELSPPETPFEGLVNDHSYGVTLPTERVTDSDVVRLGDGDAVIADSAVVGNVVTITRTQLPDRQASDNVCVPDITRVEDVRAEDNVIAIKGESSSSLSSSSSSSSSSSFKGTDR